MNPSASTPGQGGQNVLSIAGLDWLSVSNAYCGAADKARRPAWRRREGLTGRGDRRSIAESRLQMADLVVDLQRGDHAFSDFLAQQLPKPPPEPVHADLDLAFGHRQPLSHLAGSAAVHLQCSRNN
jgi:hypothetical protein